MIDLTKQDTYTFQENLAFKCAFKTLQQQLFINFRLQSKQCSGPTRNYENILANTNSSLHLTAEEVQKNETANLLYVNVLRILLDPSI